MPHGAIPMVQILPLDLEAWSFSASPTWRITPAFERSRERQKKDMFCHNQLTAQCHSHALCCDISTASIRSQGNMWIDTHTGPHTHFFKHVGVVLRGEAFRPGGHLITFLQLTFILSLPPPTVHPIQPSIHYSSLSLASVPILSLNLNFFSLLYSSVGILHHSILFYFLFACFHLSY